MKTSEPVPTRTNRRQTAALEEWYLTSHGALRIASAFGGRSFSSPNLRQPIRAVVSSQSTRLAVASSLPTQSQESGTPSPTRVSRMITVPSARISSRVGEGMRSISH